MSCWHWDLCYAEIVAEIQFKVLAYMTILGTCFVPLFDEKWIGQLNKF